MASEYDALLEAPEAAPAPVSEYDALLSPASEYDSLLTDEPAPAAAPTGPKPDDFTPVVVEGPFERLPGKVVSTSPGTYEHPLTTVSPEVAATLKPLDPVEDAALREKEREMGIAPFSLGPAGLQDAILASQPGQPQVPLIELPKPENKGIPSGIVRALEGEIEALTTPENLGLMTGIGRAGKIVQQGAALGFGAGMLKSAYDELSTAPEGETEGQAAERITGAAFRILLGGLAAKHGATGRPARGGLAPGETRPPSLTQEQVNAKLTATEVSSSPREAAPAAAPLEAATSAPSSSAEPTKPLPPEQARSQNPVPTEATSAPESAGVEGAKLGPGAANINEPLASYETRKFGERFVEDKSIDPTIREQTGNRYYEPLPNRVTAEEATKIVTERGIDEATRLIRDEKNDVTPAVRSTVGQVVIKQLNESYRALKETNPAEANKVLDKAVDLAEWQMEYGTRLGQGVQSFAMWSRLTPEGKLRTYVKAVDKARVRVEKETNGEVQKVATAAKEVSERTETARDVAIEREADRIASHLSDTPEFGKRKAPDAAVQLIREHLRTEVPEFATKIQDLGAKPETAAQLDRMATENRKRIAAVGREQRIEALRKRLTAEKNATGKKLKKSTVERIMQLADDGLLKDKEVWDAVSKDLGLPEYTPEIAREMGRLAAEVDGAAEGMPRNEAMQRLTKYMASNKGFAPSDLPLGIYYGNILSGYNTHIVNAVDTGLNVVSELGNMALANPREIPAIVRGVIRGLGEGKSDAVLALSEGRRITEGKYAEQPGLMEASKFGTKGGVPIQTKGAIGKALKAGAESKPASVLNAYKYVGRLMAASDTVFFRGAEEARAGVLAFREAQAKGVEKSQLRAEAAKLLGYDRIDEFRSQAKAEGYTGAKAEARTTELMMQARPEVLRESAADFAGNATYNHAPEGLLGYFANAAAQASNKLPALKLIVPFTRIVANVTNRGLDWTPYGYKRALAGRSFGDGPMFGEARTAALTKATVGTIGLATVGMLNQLGVIQLHGGGPSDTEKKKQLQSAGWKPYTIQIGDTYVSYLPTPLGLGLSTLANYLDADRYKELKQKDVATRTTYAFSRIASTVFNQSFLSGLSSLFEALSSTSPGKQIASIKQMFSRISSGMTVPNIARDVNRIFDPAYRDTNSIAEDLIRDIPVIRLALNPSLNAFGEPAQQPSNRFFSVLKSSPEWRIVVDKNLRIPVADDTVFTDPQAGYEYQKLAGEGMKSFVSGSLSSLKSKSTDDAQEAITRASASIFESARSRIRSKYPNSLRQRK